MSYFTNRPEVRRIWKIGGALFALGWIVKFVSWEIAQTQVTKTTKIAQDNAVRNLEEAKEASRKFYLPPLKPRDGQ
ncbi:hypothetical protein M885DRAFT_544365 [Pelagophyceae sp. CCMP2097]|nr:hypothetical protein M885DRAFT_544365 [Pelagophyceae sp. CCMP2097]